MPDRPTDAPTDPCWWDAAQGLGVCGDFFTGSGVEGAWLSGQALFQEIST
jgi:predicted NAD/FAD-dependent oxidoreductase